jgi:RNA polymerase sigma-70 factor (ECF subfamily)
MCADQLNHNWLERETLHKVAAGDQLAFTELFEQYQTLVYDFALRLTRSRSHAEEIVQDIFIKIWLNRAEVENIQNFGAYINRMARNHSYSVLRKIAAQAISHQDVHDLDVPGSSDSEHRLLYRESAKMLQTAVDELPPQRKLVYEMCHEQGLKYEEVAEKLNISRGTVHKHMKLALQSIRAHLQEINASVLIFILLNKR